MAGARAGRAGHRWRQLCAAVKAARQPCGICGQPIDYRLAWPDPDSFSVDHIIPRSVAPHLAEDPTNLQAAHLRCNQAKQTDNNTDRLGTPSRTW